MSHPLVVNVKKDSCDVYVGRPTKWGNPIRLERESDRAGVLEEYKRYLETRPDLVEAAKIELRGQRLGCYCAPKACHADVLAEIANTSEPCPDCGCPGEQYDGHVCEDWPAV